MPSARFLFSPCPRPRQEGFLSDISTSGDPGGGESRRVGRWVVRKVPLELEGAMRQWKRGFLSVFSFFLSCGILAGQERILVDHSCRDLKKIPKAWILLAKKRLHIAYGHTSHGSQLVTGMAGLVKFTKGFGGPLYSFNKGGTGGALDLRDRVLPKDVGYYPKWYDSTRAFLKNPANKAVNVVIWSWCGQVSSYSSRNMIDRYLVPMEKLEREFPRVKFVYMTGHLNIWRYRNTTDRNNQIRAFCKAKGKILYDFADIESYDPDGKHFPYANDNCDYYSSPGGKRLGNWAVEWQNKHKEGVEWYRCYAAHTQPLNANLKAFAAWWLWARLAGWRGPGSLCPGGDRISLSAGGKVGFTLEAGPGNKGRSYLLLGSMTGVSPGILLPGGKTTLPLVLDSFTLLTAMAGNSGAFQGFAGVLDGRGQAAAALVIPPGTPRFGSGKLYFAYTLLLPFDFVSRPVAITLAP